MLRGFGVLSSGVLLAALSGCGRSAPANVAAEVNGRAITYAELDKQYQGQFSSNESPSEDQIAIQKLEVLRSMIDNEIMLQRAEKASLMAGDADVEAKFNELKSPYTQEEFQKQLQSRKMTVEELKAQLRRDLSVQKLFNKEITSKISIADKDITDFYNANKAGFNLPEPQVRLSQLLVTAAAEPNVTNLKNDNAQNDEQARKKIENLYNRLRAGEDFAQIAKNYSEDPQSAASGGELGYIAESTLDRANPELRKAIMALAPGQMTPIIKTQEGYRVFKLISKEPAGQRELNDPNVQQTIRETLINRKDQLLKAAYYEVARNEAKVMNYFAAKIIGGDAAKK
jgi:peptidyl-prolyl cis-trans isomerase SurA